MIVMHESSENAEKKLDDVVKSHKGKQPTEGLVAKWIKANGICGSIGDADENMLGRRVKAQMILEKHKLIDCKKLTNAALGFKPTLVNKLKEEKALYKEIFGDELIESQELSKPLPEIEENAKDENWTTEKKRPPERDFSLQFQLSKHDTLKDSSYGNLPEPSVNLETETNETRYDQRRVERVLFQSTSKNGSISPRTPIGNNLNQKKTNQAIDRSRNEVSTYANEEYDFDIVKSDGTRTILKKILELEQLVKQEIDISEERTVMSGLLESFKFQLKKYKENSSWEMLQAKVKHERKQKDFISGRDERKLNKAPYIGLEKLVSGIKRVKRESSPSLCRSRSPAQVETRNPLKPISFNKGGFQAAIKQKSLHKTLASKYCKKLVQQKSIDLAVLRNHNFSVDPISTFQ